MKDLLTKTCEIVAETGQVIMSYYQDAFSVTEKAPDNPVSDADLAADSMLKEKLLALMPSAGWLSEETADSKDRLAKKTCWVVDPLDGTKEFVLGIPEFTISVALVDSGSPALGVILNPATGEMFAALHGQGSTYNGRKSNVSAHQSFIDATIDASRSERNRGEFKPFEEDANIQTMGSIAYKLARLSAGLVDATWSRGPKNEWDICAGVLLVQEAGGICVDLDNQELTFNAPFPKVNGIIADNAQFHDELISALAPYRASARVD